VLRGYKYVTLMDNCHFWKDDYSWICLVSRLSVVTMLIVGPAIGFAGRPLTIDDAGPVGWRQVEIEAGGGLRWQVWEPVVFDAAVDAKLHGDTPDWTATVGLTWTLDFNRKE
jgi:hypothetical protein